MNHPDYREISKRFRRNDEWSDAQPLSYAEENVDLYFLEHRSRHASYLLGQGGYACPEHGLTFPAEPTIGEPIDCRIEENTVFRFPLLREHANGPLKKHDHLVILLHGLNERSFSKYIPWAYQIWTNAQIPVAMFPLPFHINRVRREWAEEQQDIYRRRMEIPGNEFAHRFNAVISERLGVHPERFIWGALQAYWDLIDLVAEIRAGRHPHFTADTRVDVLGFSAGGYVALALLLENHQGWFERSRGVMFASCAAIRDVNLSSMLILDHAAEVALMKLYVKYREKLMSPRMKHWLDHHHEAAWFNAFLGLMPNRALLDARLKEIAPRLLAVAGSADQVMPVGAMMNALQGIRRDTGVPILELPLGIHENPFSCPDYQQRERAMITEFLDIDRYGRVFDTFLGRVCAHYGAQA